MNFEKLFRHGVEDRRAGGRGLQHRRVSHPVNLAQKRKNRNGREVNKAKFMYFTVLHFPINIPVCYDVRTNVYTALKDSK